MGVVAGALRAGQARALGGRLRRGWALMAGSCLAWGLGMAVWTAYESIGGRDVPFPSLADVGYLATVPLAGAAPLIFPPAPRAGPLRAGRGSTGLASGRRRPSSA